MSKIVSFHLTKECFLAQLTWLEGSNRIQIMGSSRYVVTWCFIGKYFPSPKAHWHVKNYTSKSIYFSCIDGMPCLFQSPMAYIVILILELSTSSILHLFLLLKSLMPKGMPSHMPKWQKMALQAGPGTAPLPVFLSKLAVFSLTEYIGWSNGTKCRMFCLQISKKPMRHFFLSLW